MLNLTRWLRRPPKCGAVAIPCLPWGMPGACPREAHEHEPCVLRYPHLGRHSWQLEDHDDRAASDPHAAPPVVYTLPAPPPRGSRVTARGRVWTHLDHTGDRALFHDLDARPAVTAIPWPNLLDEYGPLTLLDDQDDDDERLYGPRGARWGDPSRPCPYVGRSWVDELADFGESPCALGLNHAGVHKDRYGDPLGESFADGSVASVGISPHDAAEVVCTCGHPAAHEPDCPRYQRMRHTASAILTPDDDTRPGPVIDAGEDDGRGPLDIDAYPYFPEEEL